MVDTLLKKVIDFESESGFKDHILKTPIIVKVKTKNERQAIYQLEMPSRQSAIGFEGVNFKVIQFKAKVIEDDCIGIQMKSGAYIFADRLGMYFQELSMQENYGFRLDSVEK